MACKCGNTEFAAQQKCFIDVVVDEHNNWQRNEPDNDSCCYESGTPYGPYTCTKCGCITDELPK